MIQFRPHHFMCTLGFVGKGYSESFVQNFSLIADQLRNSPDGDHTPILVTSTTDSICAPCPNRNGESCTTETKIKKLDDAHAEILKLKTGMQLTWGEAKKRIQQSMTDEKFSDACSPCAWKSLGVCQNALTELRKKT